jgi:hypothetical protein
MATGSGAPCPAAIRAAVLATQAAKTMSAIGPFVSFMAVSPFLSTRRATRSRTCGHDDDCVALERAVARVGRLQSKQAIRAYIEVGRPQLEVVGRAQIASDVHVSLTAIDSGTVARLREEYQQLTVRAEDLEVELEELRCAFPREQIQRYLGPLLAQVRSIKWRIAALAQLLSLLDETVEASG